MRNTIEIYLRNGHCAKWEADKGEWDDYSYRDGLFVITKCGAWVGIYNMDVVHSIIIK